MAGSVFVFSIGYPPRNITRFLHGNFAKEFFESQKNIWKEKGSDIFETIITLWD
jgi:hypothetical protein